ncbi:MAG: NADH-quinone oxidoreductase subunit H [Candidatus Wallbacteria bacterium]|nr:NADH-quinone oxidoreductase subunit H [Candidatus Wallbacteria bacterium]
MTFALDIGFAAIHLALVLFWPLVLVGIVRRVKARLACRRGLPLLQELTDLLKLFRKGEVIPDTATWVFRLAPWGTWAASALVALMVPTFSWSVPLGAQADFILVIYLLGSSRFLRNLAALDTATAFAGLAASRESFVAALSEPAMVLSLWCAGWVAGTSRIPEMVWRFSEKAAAELSPVHPLILVALVIVAIAENARVPFDDPTTHLELTMIHEAALLEYSGPGLALMQWGAGLHLGLSLALIANLFFPIGLAAPAELGTVPLGLFSFMARTSVLAALLGVLESTMARLRFFRITDWLALSGAAAVLAVIRLVTVGR